VYDVERAPSFVTTKPVEITSDRDRYEPLIQEHARRQGLRPDLVRAVIQVESGFDKRALSPKGAMGLMQLMPDTARSLGVNNPWDPAQNIRGGTQYLRMLLDQHDNDEQLALAAYNAGPRAVARYGRIPPYRETKDYVKKVRDAAGESTANRKVTIYKTVQIVDGRAIPRYSSERPKSGSFQVVTR
jgi:soluble lytic murein transglycosylase-like protein